MSTDQRQPAIRVLMMPKHTNSHGTIFGGIILSYLDQAGAVAAISMGCPRVVTVAMDKVEFHQPVHVGDLVSFYAAITGVGRTSLTVNVQVEAQRRASGRQVAVTSADLTFVNIGEDGQPIPVPDRPRV
jgi:acyl-CoA thioesterase YciA